MKWRSPNAANNGSMRNRGPFVTQVTIREHIQSNATNSPPSSNNITSASKV